jgi:hypothetical protein
MNDQKEVLVEEYDMTEEEAEQVYKSMKTQVMLLAQTAERDWGKDEYEAVTDVLMGIQHQQAEIIEQMEESHMATLARYLPALLGLGGLVGAATAVWMALTMNVAIPVFVMAILSIVLSVASFTLS